MGAVTLCPSPALSLAQRMLCLLPRTPSSRGSITSLLVTVPLRQLPCSRCAPRGPPVPCPARCSRAALPAPRLSLAPAAAPAPRSAAAGTAAAAHDPAQAQASAWGGMPAELLRCLLDIQMERDESTVIGILGAPGQSLLWTRSLSQGGQQQRVWPSCAVAPGRRDEGFTSASPEQRGHAANALESIKANITCKKQTSLCFRNQSFCICWSLAS